MCDSFLQQQETTSAVNAENTKALKQQMQSLFAEYESKTRSDIDEAKKAVETQAKTMEQTMNAMLRDMLQNTLQAFTQTATSASTFVGTAADAANKGIEEIEASHASSADANKENIENISTSSRAAVEEISAAVVATKLTGTETDTMLSAVSGDVSSKRDNLDKTVESLVSNVDAAIQEGCSVVSDTKNTAHTVLQDVTNATEAMTDSANTAMDSFVQFMDGKGDDLQKQLETHFEDLHTHFAGQESGMASIGERVTSYGVVVAEAVDRPTGHTPKKTTFAPLQPLAATESHETIKATARVAVAAGGGGQGQVRIMRANSSSSDCSSASLDAGAVVESPESISMGAADDEDVVSSSDGRLSQESSSSSNSASTSIRSLPDAPGDSSSKASTKGRKKFGGESERENSNPNNSTSRTQIGSGLQAPSKSSRQLLRTKSTTDVEGTA